jgi:sterol desaturase/sphingolipid hydroxylase (fatty acid hydroxylase superfamily)
MDDLKYGTRNKRGDWAPDEPLALPPIGHWPLRLERLPGWIRGYFWPWGLFIVATAALWWNLFVPDTQTARTLAWGWALKLFAANAIGIFCFFGAFELRYYVRRVQGRRFKYNGRFPSEHPSDVFWFGHQDVDNLLRSFLIGVPIGTAIEALLLWAFASGRVAPVAWEAHPMYLAALALAVPLVQELHFFFIHRAMHWGPLYRGVHSVHHNSVNPSPWSSLSMHPVESALYFGVALWVLALPSHPFLAVYFFHIAGFGAIVGHIGFDRLELSERSAAASHAYAHYLHHKHFDVNYCDNGVLPLDEWFGSWHDGSPAGERLMQERFRRKKARLDAA